MVYAQDVPPPGIAARFDLTQRLEYSDNPDLEVDGDSDFFGRTVLGFGVESITKVQRFAFDIGTDLEEGRDNRDSIDVTNTFATLEYLRNTRNALLGVNARYLESDSSSALTEDVVDQDGNVINQDEGTRKSYSFGIEGAVGQEAPIGASFAWQYDKLTYSDSSDPDLTESSTSDLSGQVDFRIDSKVTARLTGAYVDYDAGSEGVSRETTGFGTGVVLDISRILTADLSLGYERIERSGTETGTDEGFNGGASLTRALPNGSVALRFTSDVASNDNGRRSLLAVDRDMDLPRGTLFYSLGVTGAGSTIGRDPIINVSYGHNLQDAVLNIGLSQRVNTDSDNEEQIITSLNAGFNQQINNVSSFGIDLLYFDRNELSDAGNDGSRFDISLTYRHDLTRDWGVVAGISHAYSTEDDESSRRSNTVFVGLERSFNWSP